MRLYIRNFTDTQYFQTGYYMQSLDKILHHTQKMRNIMRKKNSQLMRKKM